MRFLNALPRLRTPSLKWWRRLTVILSLLLDLIWITAWFQVLLAREYSWWFVFLVLGILIYGSAILGFVLSSPSVSVWVRRGGVVLWLLIAELVMLRLFFINPSYGFINFLELSVLSIIADEGFHEFILILVVLLIVRRGIMVVNRDNGVIDAIQCFQTGLIMLLVFLILFGRWLVFSPVTIVGTYVFTGLVSLAFSRISDAPNLRGGRLPALNTLWMIGIGGTAVLITTIALTLSWGISISVADVISRILAYILVIVLTLLSLIFLPVTMLLLNLVMTILSGLALKVEPIISLIQGFLQGLLPKNLSNSRFFDFLFQLLRAGNVLAMLVIVFLVAFLIYCSIQVRDRKRKQLVDQDNGNAQKGNGLNFLDLLGLLPAQLLDKFRLNRLLVKARIRIIYARLMLLCARLGYPRPPAVTPSEYLPLMKKLFPEHEDGLNAITDAYLKVRYGEIPEDPDEVANIITAWEKIKRQGKLPHLRR